MDRKELDKILSNHKKWLSGEGGERANLQWADLHDADLQCADLQCADLQCADLHDADLRGADLQGANLRGANLQWANLRGANLQWANLRGANLQWADLRGADLDLSCWPLWCGSKNVKVDNRIVYQLAAHLCVLDCDTKEFKNIKEFLTPYAKQFHRADELEV